MPKTGAVTNFSRTKEFAELKKSLLECLEKRGMKAPVYRDKVDEYMALWSRRKQLQQDVEARGLTVTDERGRMMENRSVSLEIQVSRQMLAIYQALGITERPARELDEEL